MVKKRGERERKKKRERERKKGAEMLDDHQKGFNTQFEFEINSKKFRFHFMRWLLREREREREKILADPKNGRNLNDNISNIPAPEF